MHVKVIPCPEICIMTRSPIHFYYGLIRLLAPISIYEQCTSAFCSNHYRGYGRILNNAHQTLEKWLKIPNLVPDLDILFETLFMDMKF